MISENKTSVTDKEIHCTDCWLKQFFTGNIALDQKSVFKNKVLLRYKKAESLVKAGDALTGVYCIKEGLVKILKKGCKDKEFLLWIAGKHDIVGLDAFINNETPSYSAFAIDEVEACFIQKPDLKKSFIQEPGVFLQLIKDLCKKLNFIEYRITNISHNKIKENVAELLISTTIKGESSDGEEACINYSVGDLANIIGTSKNYLSKILSMLIKEKIVSVRNRKIIINDMQSLSIIAKGA